VIVKHRAFDSSEEPEKLREDRSIEVTAVTFSTRASGERIVEPYLGELPDRGEIGPEDLSCHAARGANAESPPEWTGTDPERGPATGGPGDQPGCPATGIREDELSVGSPAHQPEDRDRLIKGDGFVPFGGFAIAFNLGGDGGAQAKPLGDQLLGELGETVINWRVEIPHGLEEAERNDGVNVVRMHGGQK